MGSESYEEEKMENESHLRLWKGKWLKTAKFVRGKFEQEKRQE